MSSASTSCSAKPAPTVRQFTARRFFEKRHATRMKPHTPMADRTCGGTEPCSAAASATSAAMATAIPRRQSIGVGATGDMCEGLFSCAQSCAAMCSYVQLAASQVEKLLCEQVLQQALVVLRQRPELHEEGELL